MPNPIDTYLLDSIRRVKLETIERDNLVRAAFGKAALYRRFLDIAVSRHDEHAKAYAEEMRLFFETAIAQASSGPVTKQLSDAEVEAQELSGARRRVMQFDTEAFYTFAKILLDRIADAIEFYFGSRHSKKARIEKHSHLVTRLQAFSSAKGLVVVPGLSEAVSEMKEIVSDVRDQMFTHDNSPRTMKGIQMDATGAVVISTSYFAPTKEQMTNFKPPTTSPLPEVLARIDNYLGLVVKFVQMNEAKALR